MRLLYGALGDQSYAGGVNYWTAGVGVEFAIGDTASLDLEYKHLWPGSGCDAHRRSGAGGSPLALLVSALALR